VVRALSRDNLRENGTVVYLHATPAMLWERIKHSRHRPMLKVADPRGRLDALYAERDPLYRSIADHVVESERETVMRFARNLAPAADAGEDTATQDRELPDGDSA